MQTNTNNPVMIVTGKSIWFNLGIIFFAADILTAIGIIFAFVFRAGLAYLLLVLVGFSTCSMASLGMFC